MTLEIPESLRKLNSMSACPIYAVGGFVRNKIAGLGDSDIDIAGPAIAEALGISRRYQTKIVNYKLGTAIIRFNDDRFEYTPFRVERYASGGDHTPIEVRFTTGI